MYTDGKNVYLKTTYGGNHYTKRFQHLPKYEVRCITFKINTCEWMSKSDALSMLLFCISGGASHLSENYSALGLTEQAQTYEYIQAASDSTDEFFNPGESWSDPLYIEYLLTVQNEYTLY